jgi:hypothetical protein
MLPFEVVTDERKLGCDPQFRSKAADPASAALPSNEDAASTASLETSILDFLENESREFFAGSCGRIFDAL